MCTLKDMCVHVYLEICVPTYVCAYICLYVCDVLVHPCSVFVFSCQCTHFVCVYLSVLLISMSLDVFELVCGYQRLAIKGFELRTYQYVLDVGSPWSFCVCSHRYTLTYQYAIELLCV